MQLARMAAQHLFASLARDGGPSHDLYTARMSDPFGSRSLFIRSHVPLGIDPDNFQLPPQLRFEQSRARRHGRKLGHVLSRRITCLVLEMDMDRRADDVRGDSQKGGKSACCLGVSAQLRLKAWQTFVECDGVVDGGEEKDRCSSHAFAHGKGVDSSADLKRFAASADGGDERSLHGGQRCHNRCFLVVTVDLQWAC